MIIKFNGKEPQIDKSVYMAPGAYAIGDVKISDLSSVWFGAVLRGDEAAIEVGKRTNIQDNAVIHTDKGQPAIIGDDVTIGHNAVIHSCEIKDNTVIGMGAVILNGAVISEGCIVAAGSVVKANMFVPENSLVAGTPAVVKKKIDSNVVDKNIENAKEYTRLSESYKKSTMGEE